MSDIVDMLRRIAGDTPPGHSVMANVNRVREAIEEITRLRALTTWRPEKGLNDILAQIDCSDSFNTNGKCEAWKLQNEILRRLVTALKSGLPPPPPPERGDGQ